MTSLAAARPRLESALSGLETPLGFVAGERSPMPYEQAAGATARAIPTAWIEIVEGAEHRVDVAVVGDVVAEVGHRRSEDRAQPDALDLQGLQVVELAGDAGQITDPVTVRVREGARVDLVDGAPLPPGRLRHAADYAGPMRALIAGIVALAEALAAVRRTPGSAATAVHPSRWLDTMPVGFTKTG